MFGDFELARKKVKNTSDLESQPEMSEGTTMERKKRKITKTRLTRYASFEISEDERSDARDNRTLSDPPKFISTDRKNRKRDKQREIENDSTVNPGASINRVTPVYRPLDNRHDTGKTEFNNDDQTTAAGGEAGGNTDAVARLLEKNLFNCKSCGGFFKTTVFAVVGEGTVCKTCLSANKWEGEPLEFYNIMLKNLPVVPCHYADEGCQIHVLPEVSGSHTKECKYRPIKCLSPECPCPWQNKQEDLVKHFEKIHQEDVIKDNTPIELDLTRESFVIVKLLIQRDAKYFLIMKRQQGSSEIMYQILNVDDNNGHSAEIKHFRDGRPETFTVQVDTQGLNVIRDSDKPDSVWKKINLFGLNAIFGGKNALLITVSVDTLSKIERLLCCSGCSETMKPPIYQCQKEHGICSSCSSEPKQCSVCQSTILRETRHFFLEDLTSNMLYPCTYQNVGCKTRIHIDSVSQHEANCRFRFYVCPLPACGYKNTYNLFKKHLTEVHINLNKNRDLNQPQLVAFNTLECFIPRSPPKRDMASFIYVDDCYCFKFELKITLHPISDQYTYDGVLKLLNEDSLKSSYLCEITVNIDSLSGKSEFWKKTLITNKNNRHFLFRHQFFKNFDNRYLIVKFTKSDL